MAYLSLSKITYFARLNWCQTATRSLSHLINPNDIHPRTPVFMCPRTTLLGHMRKPISHAQKHCFSSNSWVMWVSQTQPVLTCQSCLEAVHNTLHLPWWGTIILTTVFLRMLVTFPVTVYQHIMIARMQNLQPEMKQLAVDLKKETLLASKMYNWPEKHARYMYNRSMKKHITSLIVRDNCHPAKSGLVVLIQIPLWISLSFALRNMAYMMPYQDQAAQMLFLELSLGGCLWFPNLTIPDTSFILPVSLGIINWAIVEIHALRSVKITRFHKVITNIMRGASLIMIPIAASVPSCMALYWTTSSLIGLLQNTALHSNQVRRICQIPQTPSDMHRPLQEMFVNIKKKLKF